MADQRMFDFCAVFTMSHCALELKKNVNKFAIWSRTAIKLDIQALISYLKLTCEYELHIQPNTEVSAAKDHGKNYMKVRPPLVRHL